MSYHHKRLTRGRVAGRPLGDAPPAWYRAMNGVSSAPPSQPRPRGYFLGSLGADETPGTTLSNPTIQDNTAVWQAEVIGQLRAGVESMRKAELQKWIQVVATVTIPLSAAIWNLFLKKTPGPT